MPREKPKFQDNEKILCFHGPMLYEARCLKVEQKESGFKYFVHYQGWNKGWDEWVSDARMMKHNEAGLKKQKELEKIFLKSGRKIKALRKSDLKNQTYPPTDGPQKSGEIEEEKGEGRKLPGGEGAGQKKEASSTTTKRPMSAEEPGGTSANPVQNAGLKKKRARGTGATAVPAPTGIDLATLEMEPSLLARLQVKIFIPDLLKAWLADDCDMVTRQSKLFRIPARVNIETILERYLEAKKTAVEDTGPKAGLDYEQSEEMIKGICDYFNEVLGSLLLYKFERHQYADALEAYKDKMTQLFGVIHLLRLLSKLGELLAYTKLDSKTTPVLVSHLHDFLEFLNKNIESMVTDDDYYVATPDYQRRAMC